MENNILSLLNPNEFSQRRLNLIQLELKNLKKSKIWIKDLMQFNISFIIIGGFENGTSLSFIQEPSFLYLTGISLPGLILIVKVIVKKNVKVLNRNEKNKEEEEEEEETLSISEFIYIPKFQSQLSIENWAKDLNISLLPHFQFKSAGKSVLSNYLTPFPIYDRYKNFIQYLSKLLFQSNDKKTAGAEIEREQKGNTEFESNFIYTNVNFENIDSLSSTFLVTLQKEYLSSSLKFRSCSKTIDALRQQKTVAEQICLKKAIEISQNAHSFIQRIIEKESFEYKDLDIEAKFLAYFKQNNCEASYTPIVLSGPYGKELHGRASGQSIRQYPLLLCDVACSYFGYKADLTRTYKTTPAAIVDIQTKKIFDILNRGLLYVSTQIRPGIFINEKNKNNLNSLYFSWINQLDLSNLDKKNMLQHSIGHHIGLETHDPEIFPLNIGNIIALEVGYYSSTINIRIENCYEIIENGGRLLNLKM